MQLSTKESTGTDLLKGVLYPLNLDDETLEGVVSLYTGAVLTDTRGNFQDHLMQVAAACSSLCQTPLGVDYYSTILKLFPKNKSPLSVIQLFLDASLQYSTSRHPNWWSLSSRKSIECFGLTAHKNINGDEFFITFDEPHHPVAFYARCKDLEVLVHKGGKRFVKETNKATQDGVRFEYIAEGAQINERGHSNSRIDVEMPSIVTFKEAQKLRFKVLRTARPQDCYNKIQEIWPFLTFPFPNVLCQPTMLAIGDKYQRMVVYDIRLRNGTEHLSQFSPKPSW